MTSVDCLNVVINMKPDSLVWVVFFSLVPFLFQQKIVFNLKNI